MIREGIKLGGCRCSWVWSFNLKFIGLYGLRGWLILIRFWWLIRYRRSDQLVSCKICHCPLKKQCHACLKKQIKNSLKCIWTNIPINSWSFLQLNLNICRLLDFKKLIHFRNRKRQIKANKNRCHQANKVCLEPTFL